MMTIRRRLLATVTGVFLASTAFMGFFTYESQMNQLEKSLKDMAKNENMLFYTILSADAEGLARAHAGLARLESLSKPFAARDRKRLLSASAPVFEELRQSNSITHMYFIEPDGTVFLRVHKPGEHGDKLSRATFNKAVETKKTTSGLEMGANFFSLRSVRPVVYKGEIIGFMEIAQEIDHVFSQMKAITGNDVSLLLEDRYLAGYHTQFENGKVGNFTILYPTNRDVSLQLARTVDDTMQKALKESTVAIVDLTGAKYAVGMGPIRDAFGTTAGILLSQRDVSPLYSALWRGILASISVFVAIFLASNALLYLSLQKSLALFKDLKQNMVTVTKTSDLSKRLEVSTDDEIGELAVEFNLMKDEIKNLNERLALRAEELSAANRDLEAFNYTVSHDLRKPLTIINGYCQAIVDICGSSLDEGCKDYVTEIYTATVRMNNLIDALLEFSVVSRGELHRDPIDLSDMAKTVAAELELTETERHVSFEFAEGVMVNGDKNLFQVVMENLLGNAWKYTGKQKEAVIRFGVKEVAGEPVYFVRDNGAGFDMAESEKLFIPFQRLSGTDEFKGHGIGLATVAKIIQRHGGRVWAEGEPGKGATFYFTVRG